MPAYLPTSLALWLALFTCLTWHPAAATPSGQGEPVLLSSKGKAHLPISIPATASESTIALAKELANALEKITGAPFRIDTSGKAEGILLGTAEEWPALTLPDGGKISPAYTKEDYLIQSRPGTLLLLGRTPLATRNAVWDLLHRLGFRQYFPGAHWEIWPKKPDLTLSIDTFERPAYYSRNLPFSREMDSKEAITQWRERNRMISGFHLRANHMYEALIKRNRKHFEEHPHDIIPAPKDVKLDTSRQTVLDLAVHDSLRLLARHPEWESLSMEPSDGSNWRTDSPLGSPSNQAVTLANHVAKAVRETLPQRHIKVGLLAYHDHSPPPEIAVDPDVVVRVATAFITGGYSVETLLKGWHAKGAEMGISEFLSIYAWEYNLPGRARAADISYLTHWLPRFHTLGARHWNAQSTGSWGSDGLGYYLVSRILWDLKQADQADAILKEFYATAFPGAPEEMRLFFEKCLIKGDNVLFSEDLIGRMYRHLKAALNQAASPEEKGRLFDFVRYTHSLELFLNCRTAPPDDRPAAYEALCRFLVAHSDSPFITPYHALRRPPVQGLAPLTPGEDWSRLLYPPEELLAVVEAGITSHAVTEFESVTFGQQLRPLTPPDRQAAQPEEPRESPLLIGENRLLLYADAGQDHFTLNVEGAQLYATKGPVRIRWYAEANPLVHEPLGQLEIPADRQPHEVLLKTSFPGMHRVEITDGGGGTRVSWPPGQPAALPISPTEPTTFVSSLSHSYFFYVPKGTTLIGGYSAQSTGKLLLPDGTPAFDFGQMNGAGYFTTPVPAGMDGAIWSFQQARGAKYLLTVPPYLSRHRSEIMIPEELAHLPDKNR